jgi:molecular chaperone DnaK
MHETLLVYDLGGGTFDVSVVRVEEGIVEVQASHGDVHLGGDDFDEALAGLGEQRLREKDAATELPAAAHRRLKSAMEIAKIHLSDAPFAVVREEYLTPTCHLDTEVSRHDYEKLIEPWLQKTLDCLQRTLADAKITATDLDKIMLVGGATRTPVVQDLLLHKLGMEPRHEINPDLVVAMGAAIQGAALAGQPAPAILIDISAHTYSLVVAELGPFGDTLRCSPLVRRGTPLPVTKAEVYFTCADNQQQVLIQVCQGEGETPAENLEIGNFLVEGLSPQPRHSPIVVQFRIDLNGLLTVTATEKCTGLAKSVTIDTAGQHRINLDAARTNLAALFELQDAADAEVRSVFRDASAPGSADAEDEDDEDEDFDGGDDDEDDLIDLDDEVEITTVATAVGAPAAKRDPGAASLLASAKSLRNRAEKLLAQGVADADAAAIQANLAAVSPAIEARDWPRLREVLDALSDLLFYLED